ncbi:MAG: alpha/beta hydrolase [Burkholderiales bacterium]|nr:alpha/beta hydrolase [Burkholderiales bacterium]
MASGGPSHDPAGPEYAAGRVYLDYTQEALDLAYCQRAWATNADEIIADWGVESEKTRGRFAVHEHRYGPSEDETLDIFPAAERDAPLHVHLHGGGWRSLTKSEESFLANCLVPAGATLAVLDFSTIPKVRIPEMVAQIRRAIAWLYRHAAELGADPGNIHVSGHSSGGHLAAVLLTTDWQETCRLPRDVLKSGLVISGMYDLRPVMLSSRSSYVLLSQDEVSALSPLLHLDQVCAPITVACGETESPEFRRQAVSFAAALREAGHKANLLSCAGVNHFEILGLLGRRQNALSCAALDAMGLA